jgi:hypothetical protein
MLTPSLNAITRAKFLKVQAHIKCAFLLEDLFNRQVAFVGRTGTWRKTSFFNKGMQRLKGSQTLASMALSDNEAFGIANLVIVVGSQEAGHDDCCLT